VHAAAVEHVDVRAFASEGGCERDDDKTFDAMHGPVLSAVKSEPA
jgi:hypothetical protein